MRKVQNKTDSLQELTRTCKKIHYNDKDFTLIFTREKNKKKKADWLGYLSPRRKFTARTYKNMQKIHYNDKDFTLIFTREKTRKTRLTDLDIYLQGAKVSRSRTLWKGLHCNNKNFLVHLMFTWKKQAKQGCIRFNRRNICKTRQTLSLSLLCSLNKKQTKHGWMISSNTPQGEDYQ